MSLMKLHLPFCHGLGALPRLEADPESLRSTGWGVAGYQYICICTCIFHTTLTTPIQTWNHHAGRHKTPCFQQQGPSSCETWRTSRIGTTGGKIQHVGYIQSSEEGAWFLPRAGVPHQFHLKMRKNFFPLRVMEHWNRLPREVVESPSLEIFKTCPDKVLSSLL